MYEVEVKVEAAHGPVRARLNEMDAEPLGVVHQRDIYYDHPTRSFAVSDEAVRLRRESRHDERPRIDAARKSADEADGASDDWTTTARLTYKGPLVDDASKTRAEVETDVADPDATDAILRAVGFEPAAEVEKARERFACEGYTVALDSVRDLGEFVEIEAKGSEPEVDRLREGAFDLCRRLGLDPADSTRTSYLALLLSGGGRDA